MSWLDYLQTASFRGVPFGVFDSERGGGRRMALHEYPFRDDVWPEDLGLATRGFDLRGFLVGDDCYAQEDAMHAVCAVAGVGLLVHPTRGAITVSLMNFSSRITYERGGVVELQFRFVLGATSAIFPSAITDALSAISDAADLAQLAASGDYAALLGDLGASGSGWISTAAGITGETTATVSGFVSKAGVIAGDAGIMTSAVAGLSGNYGRYGAGNLTALQSPGATVSSVLAGVTTARTDITAAGSAASELASLL
jgi:prophage DNA circulation protein